MKKLFYLTLLFGPIVFHGIYSVRRAFKIIQKLDISFSEAKSNPVYKKFLNQMTLVNIIIIIYMIIVIFYYNSFFESE